MKMSGPEDKMQSSSADIFPHRRWNPYRLPVSIGLALFLLSVGVHLGGLLIASRVPHLTKSDIEPQRTIDVQLANPVIDTLQETAKEKPTKAKFESSRNLDADEDTSPERSPTSWSQKRGKPDEPRPASKPRERSKPSDTLFSLKQEDLIKRGEIRQESLSGNNDQLDSSGFLERLKKGAQLKVSALESDYGQYVTRMKRKLTQQWSPQRTITAAMYGQDQVTMGVGVVLNKLGEVVELRTVEKSNFSDFDKEALRAIQEAAPFPNPPKSLFQDDGLVYMPWYFTIYTRGTAIGRVE